VNSGSIPSHFFAVVVGLGIGNWKVGVSERIIISVRRKVLYKLLPKRPISVKFYNKAYKAVRLAKG